MLCSGLRSVFAEMCLVHQILLLNTAYDLVLCSILCYL